MIKQREIHKSHKKHRNVLYSLVILLALFQIVFFTVISLQVSSIESQLRAESEARKTENSNLKEFTTNLVETYDSLYQENFIEISSLLSKQEEDFQQEISLLKSTQKDFSGIVEQSVKGVVTVSTDNSLGSGFIVSDSGFVVTNYHVIKDNEDSVRILTYDRQILSAEIIGIEELRDLALLKVSGNFDELELADSDSLQVGQKVIAIGNPLGLSFTVTEGIISGLERRGPNGLREYVQTDVSLNPGNSGGPLINTEGKVVGINNFKIGGAEGLSFSLESNLIRQSVNGMLNATLIE